MLTSVLKIFLVLVISIVLWATLSLGVADEIFGYGYGFRLNPLLGESAPHDHGAFFDILSWIGIFFGGLLSYFPSAVLTGKYFSANWLRASIILASFICILSIRSNIGPVFTFAIWEYEALLAVDIVVSILLCLLGAWGGKKYFHTES